MLSIGLTVLVALMHVWFLVLEMFLWTKPIGLKTFRQSAQQANDSAVLAGNQGLYNGFLAAGLVWSLVASNPDVAFQTRCFFLSCVVIAGLYGAATVNRRIFFVQTLPALLALAAHVLVSPAQAQQLRAMEPQMDTTPTLHTQEPQLDTSTTRPFELGVETKAERIQNVYEAGAQTSYPMPQMVGTYVGGGELMIEAGPNAKCYCYSPERGQRFVIGSEPCFAYVQPGSTSDSVLNPGDQIVSFNDENFRRKYMHVDPRTRREYADPAAIKAYLDNLSKPGQAPTPVRLIVKRGGVTMPLPPIFWRHSDWLKLPPGQMDARVRAKAGRPNCRDFGIY